MRDILVLFVTITINTICINRICITKFQQGGVGFIFLAPRGQERHIVQKS